MTSSTSARPPLLGDAAHGLGGIGITGCRRYPCLLGIPLDCRMLAQGTSCLQGHPIQLRLDCPTLGLDATGAVAGQKTSMTARQRCCPALVPQCAPPGDEFKGFVGLRLGVCASRRMSRENPRQLRRTRTGAQQGQYTDDQEAVQARQEPSTTSCTPRSTPCCRRPLALRMRSRS